MAELTSILNSILEMALTFALESLAKLADISFLLNAAEKSVRTVGAKIGRDEARSQSDHLLDLESGIGGVSLSTDKSFGCSHSMCNDRDTSTGHTSWRISSISCDSLLYHSGDILSADCLSIEVPVCSFIGDCVWLRVLGATSASDEDIVALVEQEPWNG